MKKTALFAAFIAVLALGTSPARAQIDPAPNPEVESYLKNTYDLRTDRWWKAFNMQMLEAFNKPYDQIDEKALQNAIYFATHYREKIDLTLASHKLLQVYRKHDDVAYRILALSAIHAIADAETMEELPRFAWRQQPVVKRLMRAAVADYQRTHGRL